MAKSGLTSRDVTISPASAFTAIGLDDDSGRVLEALAADDRCDGSIESVATCTGLTRARTARTLATLVELGLATKQVDDEHFSPNPVEAALGALVATRREELVKAEAAARQLALKASRRQQRQRPEQLVSIVEGSRQIGAVKEQLLRTARHMIRTFDRPPYVTPQAREAPHLVDTLHAEVIGKGIQWRTVYDARLLEDASLLARIRIELSEGEQGRVLPDLPLKLMVADDSLAILPLIDPVEDREPAALLIHQSVLLDSLITLFEALWRAATPLVLSGDEVAAQGEDPDLRRVVELLAGGLTEERLARLLGISDRTVRRRLSTLRENLGASTMFQAGVAAAHKGWV